MVLIGRQIHVTCAAERSNRPSGVRRASRRRMAGGSRTGSPGTSARREPTPDLGPNIQEGACSHEQAEVGARQDHLPDLTALAANKTSGGEQLFGSNDLIFAGGDEENWAPNSREINWASKGGETACRKLIVFIQRSNDLQIISPGQVDRPRVPFKKKGYDLSAARRGDVFRDLQQRMN
jgi:hypothetical protein